MDIIAADEDASDGSSINRDMLRELHLDRHKKEEEAKKEGCRVQKSITQRPEKCHLCGRILQLCS
jgi:predicted molibdopterin-dependent oxidoreductase YjgC